MVFISGICFLIFITSLFISFEYVINSPCDFSDYLDGEWISSGKLESTSWTNFPLTHKWVVENQWEIKYHESKDRGNNCEDHEHQYLEAKFVLRNKSHCELWDYAKCVKFIASYFDKMYGSKKLNIFVVGDSLGGQYAITTKIVSEINNLTDIVNVEFLHDHTFRNDVPCNPKCVNNTEFREKKFTACSKCLKNYTIDTFQVSSPNLFLNRIPIGTNILFLSTGIWYNNFKMADNLDNQSYESTLHLIAPLLKLLVDRGLVIVLIALPFRSNEETSSTNPLYEWDSYVGKDNLAKIVFNNTGIIFVNYNSAIELRKDPKIFKDSGVHYCLPGVTGASNFLIENIMQSIASSLYHKLEKNYNILCPKKSIIINNEKFEINSCWT